MSPAEKPHKATGQVRPSDHTADQAENVTDDLNETTSDRASLAKSVFSSRRATSLKGWKNRRRQQAKTRAQREAWMTEHADEHRIEPKEQR